MDDDELGFERPPACPDVHHGHLPDVDTELDQLRSRRAVIEDADDLMREFCRK